MRRAMALVMIAAVLLVGGCSLGGALKRTFGTTGRTVGSNTVKGVTVAGKYPAKGTMTAVKTVGEVFTGNSEDATRAEASAQEMTVTGEKTEDSEEVKTSEAETSEDKQERKQILFLQQEEVYVPSYYLRKDYLQESLDLLEAAGYTLSTSRKAPLKLKVSIKRIREGGYARIRFSRKWRGSLGARTSKYRATAYLEDQSGRVVARGWGESPSKFNFQIPRTRSLKVYGSNDAARARAALVAINTLVVEHQRGILLR